MRAPIRTLWVVMFLAAVAGAEADSPQRFGVEVADGGRSWPATINGALPRWREGGPPPVPPTQSLYPYAISVPSTAESPTSGQIVSPPEYAPADGVVFRYNTGAWPTVVRDCVAALTGDPAHDEIAYVVAANPNQQNTAEAQFAAAGADLSKVVFMYVPTNSIWLRDYGPHFIWQNGALAIVDSHYYPTRPQDNFVPTRVGDDQFQIPTYDMGLYYSGGNFQPAADGYGFVTNLIQADNGGFSEDFIAELYGQYQGIDTLHIFPRLPGSVDGTGHIDMWFYLVDEDTVIVSEFLPGSNPTAISITNNGAAYMEDVLGYEVFRVPDQNVFHPQDPQAHLTYTNAFRVNDRIFIPSYGQGNAAYLTRDAQALATWQQAAPDAEIVPINCWDIIPAAGAIHCIVMQVPRYTGEVPSAHVVDPDGGEIMLENSDHVIRWAASDNNEVTSVDVYGSDDGGQTYDEVIALDEPNDGAVDWQIPAGAASTASVMVVANDGDGNFDEAQSQSSFRVVHGLQHVYDFSQGAGIDKWAYGYQTVSWFAVDGMRQPTGVVSQLTTDAYNRISASDAESANDFDPNRYRAPVPTPGRESTHVFEIEIDEDPARILDIGVAWEGYADACTQAELYVWDYVEGQWGDGAGQLGENRFLDNWAANRDRAVGGHITQELDRYVSPDGPFTFLIYAERNGDTTMHDYVAVTVTHTYDGDFNGDGDHDLQDFDAFEHCVTGPDGSILTGCDDGDLDGDGDVDLADFAGLQQLIDQ